MRPLWKGAITFGLVTIPVFLLPATRREELKFHLLRKKDLSRINNKRVAEVDGKEVPWDDIVKGYEYEKGKYVVLKDEDFARVDVEATQTVDIINFVSLEEIDPLLFYKPYFLEVAKGGDKAYGLLRDALVETGKIAISRVVIRTRQHLAAVKPQKEGLMLELMHFPDELIDVSAFKEPVKKPVSEAEMTMAKQLISSMSKPWDAGEYNDDYHTALENLIEEKVQHPDAKPKAASKKRQPSNVIDLVAILQKSLQQSKGGTGARKKETPTTKSRKAAKAKQVA